MLPHNPHGRGALNQTGLQFYPPWLLNQDIPVIPIIGSLDVGHLTEDLGATEIKLTAAEVAWLAEGSVTSRANAVLSP